MAHSRARRNDGCSTSRRVQLHLPCADLRAVADRLPPHFARRLVPVLAFVISELHLYQTNTECLLRLTKQNTISMLGDLLTKMFRCELLRRDSKLLSWRDKE